MGEKRRPAQRASSLKMGQSKSKKADVSKKDLQAYQASTDFNKVELRKLIAAFDAEANSEGVLDRAAWKRVLTRLEEAGLRKNLASDPFADDLYDVVDTNGDGFVDKGELLSGLSLTCKGTPQQRMDLMFQLWDTNGDGKLDQSELMNCFQKCYRSACLILLRKNPKAEKLSKVELNELADELAQGLAVQVSKQIFEQMDQDGNGYIDRHEFSAIFSKGGLKITAEVEGQEFSGFMGYFSSDADK